MNYWHWLLKGHHHHTPGIRRFYNRWLIVHVVIGFFLALIINVPIYQAAHTIVMPLAILFMGFLFVWFALQNLLQTEKMVELLKTHPQSYEKYVYVYQTAILIFLVCLAAWGLADLKVFDDIFGRSFFAFLVKVILFSLLSLTLRECWHLVLGISKLSLLHTKNE